MKKILVFCLALMLLMPLFSARAGEKQITLMIYMTGSDLEANYSAATADILEMIKSGYDREKVNLVIMTGGSESWQTPGVDSLCPGIYHLEKARLIKDTELPMESMGSAGPLSALMHHAFELYPARHYALIIWDHGMGPVSGLCIDTLHDYDALTPEEMRQALENSPFHENNRLSFIGFDACLMANAETACLISPYAEYMIASQDTEPGRGWDYSFLSDLHLDASGAQTGERIIDCYYQSSMARNPGNNITLSLIDLGKIAPVRQAADQLFSAVRSELSEKNFSSVAALRRSSVGVSRAASADNEWDLVDLTALSRQYAALFPDQALALEEALDDAILYNKSNIEGLEGLSVYHPYYNKSSFVSGWQTAYRQFPLSEEYLRYLDAYTGIWLGEQLTGWEHLRLSLDTVPGLNAQKISLSLTPEQQQNLAGAELLIFSADEHWGYGFTYRETLTPPDEAGRLQITYDGRQLYVLDENGQMSNSQFSYTIADDHYVLQGYVTPDHVWNGKSVCLHYRLSEDGDTLQFLYAEEQMEDGTYTTRHDLDFSYYRYFYCVVNSARPTYSETGELLPFSQWQDDGTFRSRGFDISRPYTLKFSSQQVDSAALCALMYVYDTQGNLHVTHLLPLENPNAHITDAGNTLLLDNEECRILLNKVEMVSSSLDAKVRFHLDVENKTENSLPLQMEYVFLDDTAFQSGLDIGMAYGGLEPGERRQLIVSMSAQPLDILHFSASNTLQLQFIRRGETADDQKTFLTEKISLPLDFSPLLSAARPPQPLAVCRQEGVKMELISLSVDEKDLLQANIRITNETQTDLKVESLSLSINGVQVSEFSGAVHCLVPAGKTMLEETALDNRIHTGASWSIDSEYFISDAMSALGLDAVESITLRCLLYGEGVEKRPAFTFSLPTPYDYASHRSLPLQGKAAAVTLYEDERLSLQLMGFEGEENRIAPVFVYRNKTDTPLEVNWHSFSINHGPQESMSLVAGADSTVLPHTALVDTFTLTGDNIAAPWDVHALRFQGDFKWEGQEGRLMADVLVEADLPAGRTACYGDTIRLAQAETFLQSPVVPLSDRLMIPQTSRNRSVLLQAADVPGAQEVTAHLMVRDENCLAPLVCGIVLQKEEGAWRAPFSGLYISREGESDAAWAAFSVSILNGKETWKMSRLFAEGNSLLLDSMTVPVAETTFSSADQEAILRFEAPLPATDFPQAFDIVQNLLPVYEITRDAQGRLPHMKDMQALESMIWANTFADVTFPLQLCLLPVEDYPGEVQVMFSYLLEDGTAFSADLVPYHQFLP